MQKHIWIILFGLSLPLYGQEGAFSTNQLSLAPKETDAKIKNFETWAKDFYKLALAEGITEKTLEKARKHFIFDPRVIVLDQKQPEGMLDFNTYYDARVPPKLTQAQQLYDKHKTQLKAIEKKYGVPASVIIALWGMETHFGKLKGKYIILGSLATLAYEGRRAEYFTKELVNALKIIQNHKIKQDDLKGSWAGAMGHCQFMPSTYLNHATTGDDAKKSPDIWNSLDHVFASMANYLHNLGWNMAEPICIELELPTDFDETLISPTIKKSWKDWQLLGVEISEDQKLQENVIGYLQKAPLTDRVYLAVHNYELLLQWNKSNNFALSVGLFAEQLERS